MSKSHDIYLANIHIPIINYGNGKLESLTNNIYISYDKIDKIPPKSTTPFTYDSIKEQLLQFLGTSQQNPNPKDEKDEEKIIIKLDEIKSTPKKRVKNSTFKQRSKQLLRHTSRVYASEEDQSSTV